MDLSPLAYLVAGFLLGNGMPHFIFGSAKRVFKSPFGQRSKPEVNVLWGLANFIVASGIVATEIYWKNANGLSIVFILAGFWMAVLMFGFSMERFLGRRVE